MLPASDMLRGKARHMQPAHIVNMSTVALHTHNARAQENRLGKGFGAVNPCKVGIDAVNLKPQPEQS